MTRNTRATTDAGMVTLREARLAGACVSAGVMRANTMPHAMANSPGIANAARQPRNLTASPVDNAASAMPMISAKAR